MAVTMKNADFWDVTLCGCCKNGRLEEASVVTRATRLNISEDVILPVKILRRCTIELISPL
jgi:hypothetical protein